MNESTTATADQFTPAASLAALGLKLQQVQLFEPIHRLVHLQQKTVKYRPTDKLYDGFIALLAGAHGLVEITTRLRADPALQAAFGRTGCAEQSVVQQTLDGASAEQVGELEQAGDEIYRRHGRGYGHDYAGGWQVLDGDLSGWLCGKTAAFATTGYFASPRRNRRGRQLGRVLATRYGAVVVDRLFPGNQQLNVTLPALLEAAEATLALGAAQRARCLVRVDAGGGSVPNLNWLLERDYHILVKGCSGQPAQRLATTVRAWVADPRLPERPVGWIPEPAAGLVRPVRRVAVRCPKADGRWGVGVLVGSLDDPDLLALAALGAPAAPAADEAARLALVALYDQRGGGVETSFKGDKGGLGLTHRNKRRFAAQQMVMLLGTLAHNALLWARSWLMPPPVPQSAAGKPAVLAHYGPLRLVRDVVHISGRIRRDATGRIVAILLNPAAPLARPLLPAMEQLLAPLQVAVNLDKT